MLALKSFENKKKHRFYAFMIILTWFPCDKKKIKSTPYASVEVFSTAVLIGDTKISKQILQIEQARVKNPN